MSEILFFAAAFVSELIGTIAGFGSSTIFLPLSLFFVDFKTALALVAFFHFSGNVGRLLFFGKSVDLKITPLFAAFSFAFALLGAWLAIQAPAALLKMLLGVFLVAYSLYSFVSPNFVLRSSKPMIVLGGASSGFLAGLIGTGGALRSAFVLGFRLDKEKYVATMAVASIAADLARTPLYLASGFLEASQYYYLPILFAIALLASFAGKKVVQRLREELFRKIVLLALLLIGLKFVADYFA